MFGATAELRIVLALIAVNGVLAMSELAIVSVRKVRLQQRAEAGDAGARAALELAAEPSRFLSTVQRLFVGVRLRCMSMIAPGVALVSRLATRSIVVR